jgi:hypothetical protein
MLFGYCKFFPFSYIEAAVLIMFVPKVWPRCGLGNQDWFGRGYQPIAYEVEHGQFLLL